MAARSGLRIGDADREATAAGLREHFAQGRLTMEEFQQRLDAAFAAKTDLDLAKVTSDLPHAPVLAAPWSPSRPPAGASGGGSWSGRGARQGSWRVRSHAWAVVNLAILVLAVVLVVDFLKPFAWLGAFVPKPVLILVAVLVFVRQALRRVFRGGWPRPRGRRRL